MSIKEKRDSWNARTGGYLIRFDRNGEPPHALDGHVKNECGLASVTVDYLWNGAEKPLTQYVRAETVIDGRVIMLHQERSKPDWLTERGIKAVVGRWLRELSA